jgi:hypothetical protein
MYQIHPRRTRSKKEDKQILQGIALFIALALLLSFLIAIGMIE